MKSNINNHPKKTCTCGGELAGCVHSFARRKERALCPWSGAPFIVTLHASVISLVAGGKHITHILPRPDSKVFLPLSKKEKEKENTSRTVVAAP